MASPYAFVTLLTSDSYLPGVLTLAAALKDIHPSPPVPPEVDFQTVCLVTPETVDIASIKLLRKAFDLVVGVEIIEEDNERGLQLLGEYPPLWLTFPVTRSVIRTTLRFWAPRTQDALNPNNFRNCLYRFASISSSLPALYASFPAVSSLPPSTPSNTRSS